ncbi:N-acetylmuramoyl-L-alanine amidase [Streptacidiphilus sp. N1-12]|uniref:N-acetylmuramoyl-L-alanine amidase n=2 Tax=Streptacidiphilus alkalitolerans TaxID=3342712 RepID=A0ABV6WDB0_9ACTN
MTARHGRSARGKARGPASKRSAKHGRAKSRLWAGAAAGLAVGGLVVGAVADAATGTVPAPVRIVAAAQPAPAPSTALQADFAAAAAEFHVPVAVLLAVSYQQTLWESHQGGPSITGNYNVMGLTSVGRSDLPAGSGTVDTTLPALHTLDAAAALIQQPDAALRGQMEQSVRGGAALLASYEQQAEGSLPTDPGQWYAAVARFSQGPDASTQEQFADRVYQVIATGAARTTDDHQTVALRADPSVRPRTPAALSSAGPTVARSLAATPSPARPCEAGTATGLRSCAYLAAASGNVETAKRPTDGDAVRDIVIDTTAGSAAAMVSAIRTNNPAAPASDHFVVAATGAVTQLVRTSDVALHAGNDTLDAHSIGVANESYGLRAGSWISEPEYAASAALVRNLAALYGIPLDRQHILGHDDVPAPTGAGAGGQQDDPGPYWDWAHYLSLLGAPALDGTGLPMVGGTVTIAPDYASNKPVLTGCSGGACVAHPANFVYLRTAPASAAPLIGDPLLQSAGAAQAGTGLADVSDKAVYGQSFVVAAVSGSWTAIWYGGQEAWFYNPGGVNSYANSNPGQSLVIPNSGTAAIAVYGRAYPEAAAYTAAGVPADARPLVALPDYTITSNQAYTTTGSTPVTGDYYDYDGRKCGTAACKVVIGTTQYYEIRYNHRLAYVLASDVQTIKPKAPPAGNLVPVAPTRVLDTRTGTGGVPVARVPAGGTVTLQVTGTAGVPADGVTAVVLQVTAVKPSAPGFITVHPDGRALPAVPTVDYGYAADLAQSDLAVVPVVNGKVDFYNHNGTVDLVADLTGYFTTDATVGSTFVPSGPTRILSTVTGTGAPKARLGPGGVLKLKVAGTAGVPADGVTAVVLNVTAVAPTAAGAVSVHPDGSDGSGAGNPAASDLTFGPGQLSPRTVIVPVLDGTVDFSNRAGTVDLVADLDGYFTTDGSGGMLHTAGPVRVMDTRDGTGVRAGRVGPGETVTLQVGGRDGVPLSATAVVLNVTAVRPSADGSVTVLPYGPPTVPTATSLGFGKGELVSGLVIVPVVKGRAVFFNRTGTVDLVADLTGYFTD